MPDKKDILDLYFMDARHKLIDLAAYLDRIDRHDGDADFRHAAFFKALDAMQHPGDQTRAQAVLNALSDHSAEPADKAGIQFAYGAPPEQGDSAGSRVKHMP